MNQDLCERKPFFDKDVTAMIKAVALVFMFIHHFFTFPSWWVEGVNYQISDAVVYLLAYTFKSCVFIFCFITGYMYFFNKNKTFKYSVKKIRDLYIPFWIVYLVFALIAITVFSKKFTINEVIRDLVFTTGPVMCFCWYVFFYAIVMLLFPVIVKVLYKNPIVDIIAIIIISLVSGLMRDIINQSIVANTFWYIRDYYPVVLIGYFCARYSVFEKINRAISKVFSDNIGKAICWLVLLPACLGIRFVLPNIGHAFGNHYFIIGFDIIYIPLFVYSLACLFTLLKNKYCRYPFVLIGKHSMIMWFVSCIFFDVLKDTFQPILYLPHNPVLVLIWGIILCLIPALIYEFCKRKIVGLISNKKRQIAKGIDL